MQRVLAAIRVRLVSSAEGALGLVLNPFKKNCYHPRNKADHLLLPHAFEIGESSRKASIEHHEEQIEEILNHLGELSLDRIEHIEDKFEGLGKGRVIILQDFDILITELGDIINDMHIRHQADIENL
ncbi:hypothetical protein Tco_0911425 [Tanacetum coccineum]|uniref:Uncharacterized protein n=1 Tax=Tanacetum coccineum TaxID=301880 RepID=A0ABQ5CWP8_9ASTR